MDHKPLKCIWVFKHGQFVGRRWVCVDEQETPVHDDAVSTPGMAAFSTFENLESVDAGLSEKLARKTA